MIVTFVTPLKLDAMLRHSPIPLNHFGPLAFGPAIRAAPYPRCFQPPMHISKYDSETNSDHWLEDYRLAMKARGSYDDFSI
jgi:hypothetical protein